MSTTLPLFWHLSSVSKKERIDASVKLVGSLEQFQTQFTQQAAPGASGSDDEEEDEESAPKSDGLDLSNAQDVSYSIRRLVRGLASSREQSRLGFAVALTELLSRIDTVTCSQIMCLITESTKNQGSMTGQEERDVLFAQLFGIMSIVQSGLVVRTKPLATSASSSTAASSAESFLQIVSQLLELGEKRSWLRESAWFAISLATEALHHSDTEWKEDALEKLLELLFQINANWSTEKIAVALKLQDYYPQRDWKTLLSSTFKNPDLLSSANLATISRILKESTGEVGQKDSVQAPSGTWKPQLNFAWDIILDQMLPGPNSHVLPKGSFQDFFKIVVDESLFSSTASAQRKLWGFQVFQKSLRKVDENTMPTLFTKNFMRSWINHLSKKDRYLHKVAQRTAAEVQAFVNDKPQLGFALILQLTGPHGSQQFDKLTKTKTVESILPFLEAKGIQSYIDHLFSLIDEPDKKAADLSATNARRAWIIDQLGVLIRNGKIPKEDYWIQSILNWLVVNGLFVVKKKSSRVSIPHAIHTPAFSDELRRSCRNKLLTCLSDLGSQTTTVKQNDKSTKIPAVGSDGEFWISKVLLTIEQLEAEKKSFTLFTEVDEEDAAIYANARDTIAKLRKASGDQQESAKGAELLLLGTLLQQYCAGDDDEGIDPTALEVCSDAASRMLLTLEGKKKKKSKQAEDTHEEAMEEPVDVLVDTIIGFLEESTSYMRTIGNEVFSLLSGSVKESTIDLIVTQLERRNPAQLAENEDDTMADTNADENDDEDFESGDDEDDDQSNGEHSGDDSANEGEADLELRNKIEEALRINGIEPATGETDSEEEGLMDDDEMMAIDEQLAQVFRSRANELKAGKNIDVQREATHFKNRVLDLVDTYLKKQHSNPLVLRLITPLVDIIAGSGQDERQLADKARGILRSRFNKAKEVPTDVDANQVVVIATNLHIQARKTHSSDLLSVLSLCSVYVAKILINLNEVDLLLDLYKQSLADFVTRKNSGLNAHFFQDFIKRFPSQAWSSRQDLIDISEKCINTYRQSQVLQLLALLIGLLPSMPERNDEAIVFMPILSHLLIQVADKSCTDEGGLTAPQMKDLLKLALLAVRQTKRIFPASTQSIWRSQAWLTFSKTLKTSRFKASTGLHKMCEQLIRTSEVVSECATSKCIKAAGSKRKMEEIGPEEIVPSSVGKKSRRKKAKE
ncbi:hypothetical protein HYPSUDRAFT_35394 [Hypholoma sublateritium FD-334 SS-4]|uniref:DNA polymerase V n=1 Tax=Hypholoma sublateritium (strain FD-334 SS-4) TaxID=945553 RepID=A0A0D2P972_HYPSF|nr:hypothetical protein HYPSUDRAFT_35394 [Hypholoma sublateritium FD-334 SS-4]